MGLLTVCVSRGPDIQERQFGGLSLSLQRRVIHFASGETLEEDDSEEEDTLQEEVFREPEDMVGKCSNS